MNSKEFNRRVSYYSEWLTAFELFTTKPVHDSIWKISVFEICSVSRVFYSSSPFITPISLANVADEVIALERMPELQTVVIERYGLSCFHADLNYFKSFIKKLTDYQMAVLSTDNRFINILNYIFYEKK